MSGTPPLLPDPVSPGGERRRGRRGSIGDGNNEEIEEQDKEEGGQGKWEGKGGGTFSLSKQML